MSCNTSESFPLVAATWGEIEHTTRVFAGLHASLADPTLPIPAAVRASMPAFTWAHVIDVLRVTQSSKWREGTGFCKSVVAHHALWLLLGSDTPLPLEASRTLTGALTGALAEPFEEEARAVAHAIARRSKKLGEGATFCVQAAARVTVAHSMRWSAPADLVLLRYLMIDAKDASRKLRDSIAAAAPRPAALPSPPARLPPSATTELPAEAKGLQLRRSDSNVSGYMGVLKLNNGRFAARPSKWVSLGTFDTAVDAAVACAANEQAGCFCRKGCGNSFIGDWHRIPHEQNCLGHAAVEDDGERPAQADGLQLHMSNSATSYKGVQKDSAGFFVAHLPNFKVLTNSHDYLAPRRHDYLGKFDTAVEAAVAYARAVIRANSLAAVAKAQAEAEAQAEARNVLRTRHENSSTGQVKDGPRKQPKGKAKAASVPASAPAVKAPARQQGTASKKRSLVVLVDAAGVPWYEVDTLLAMRQPLGAVEREFLVRWRGYSPADDSWEAESNIDEGLVQAFASADRGAKAPGASASGTTLLNSADAKVPACRKRRVVAPVHQAGDASSATGPPAWLSGVQKVQRVGNHYQASLPVCAALPPAEGSTATDAPVRVCRNTLEQQAARDSAAQLTATAFGLDAFSFVAPCDCGLGLFARVPLRAGQFISEYDGPRLPQRLQVRGRYVLHVPGTSTVIDGASENSPFECERSLAVYANHSSRPNARLECRPPLPQQGIPRMLLVAVEPIEAGQEVRIDYEDGAAGEAVYWAGGPPSETAWRRVRLHPPPPTLEEPSYARLDERMESTTARRPTLPWEGPTGGDARLQALVTLFSISNHQATACDWQLVSTHLPGRSWRECRERWLFMLVADGHAAWLTSPAKASISHAEAAAAMAEAHRAAANKAAMEAAGEERVGEGLARCCILGCTEQLLQCNGQKHAGCEVGCAENWHVICAPCLDRWHSSQAALRDKFGLSKQTRRTCPVCKAELRAAGSTMRGVADQYAMGLQKVAGTWRY